MLKTLKCDLARCIANRGFACAVIVTAVLCFSAQIYYDSSNGKAYSVFEALFSFDRAFMSKNSDFSPASVIETALSGYSAMALPVTAAFPFVFSFITERNSGNMRLSISRTSRRKHYFSKFISALLCGGICTMLGVILFGLFAFILFPSTQFPEILSLVKKLLSAFVYGAASVLPAFFLCSFCKNPYIILCVPFMLKFISETLISRIQINAAAAGDFDIYERTFPFYPNSVTLLFHIEANKTFFIIIAVNLTFAAAVFAGFALIMEKRADRGN